jgi:hypothetical protein
MEWAILQGNRNRNFDQASARIATYWPWGRGRSLLQ